MNIRLKDLENLNDKGVYAIYNTKNCKVYIGSTTKSFTYRLKTHEQALNRGNHENVYLQRSWRKYKNFFEFRILMITDDNFYWEQKFIDFVKPFGSKGYNMNRLAACPPRDLSEEVFKKRAKTLKQTTLKAKEYYEQYINNEIDLDDIPKKYINIVNRFINMIPWNKGKTGYNVEYPSDRNSTKEGLKKRREAFKKKRKPILVYKDDIFIGEFDSAIDISENIILQEHVSLFRSKRGRELKIPNICASCRTGKPYKGLVFKYKSPSV